VAGTAIVGMACLFPGAPDMDRYWRNIVDGVDAIGEVPAARWDPVFYDPASKGSATTRCAMPAISTSRSRASAPASSSVAATI
jgi:acyl transferase domain-containing protein